MYLDWGVSGLGPVLARPKVVVQTFSSPKWRFVRKFQSLPVGPRKRQRGHSIGDRMAGPCSAAHGRVTFSSNAGIGKWPRHIKAYYSTVFEQSAPGGLENRSRFQQLSGLGGRRRRERDRGRQIRRCRRGCQARALPGPAHSAAAAGAIRRQAVANLRILRRGDTGRRDELTGTFRSSFGKWLESLRGTMANLPAGFPEARDRRAGRAFAARFGLIYPQYLPISGYSADSEIARGLLHSRAAFGIALRVAGE